MRGSPSRFADPSDHSAEHSEGGPQAAKSPRSRAIHIGARVLGAAIAIVVFGRTVAATNLHDVGALLLHVGPWTAIMLLPAIGLILAESWSWSRLYRLVGAAPSFWRLLSVRWTTEAIGLSIPGGAVAAEAMKVVLGRSRLGIPSATTSATIAARAPLALLAMSIYLVVGVFVNAVAHHDMRMLGVGGLSYALLGAAAVLFLVATAMSFALRGSLAARMHRLLLRIPIKAVHRWVEEQKRAFDSADTEVDHIRESSPGAIFAAGFPLLAGLFAQTLETWIMLRLLGASLPFGEIVCLDAAVSIIRSIAFLLPAGLGLTDLTYVAAFHALGLGEAESLGALFAILKRARDLIVIAIGYLLLLLGPKSGAPAGLPHVRQNTPTCASYEGILGRSAPLERYPFVACAVLFSPGRKESP